MIGGLQRESEIVHGEHVFEELGLLKIANATSLARVIQRVRQRSGARIEIVIVLRFVDADAPQYDRRTVPVAANHAAHIVNGHLLPAFVADMLPPWDFL